MSLTVADEAPGIHVILDGFNGYGIALVEAGWLRTGGWRIVREPEENNPAHVVVVGSKKDKKFLDQLARRAELLVVPSRCLGEQLPTEDQLGQL